MSCLYTNLPTHKYTSIYDRIQELLVSQKWSDCSFAVAGKLFNAHKLILASSSPVFEAMFYGPWTSEDTIEIIDIHPDIFQLLLNYMYTDYVEINSIEDALDLLYTGRKYMLDDLSEICISYIESNINMNNVIEILNYPEHLQDTKSIDSATNFFCKHAHYTLEEIEILTYSGLKVVLESDYMNVTEKDLIKHVFKWASYYCEQNNIPNTVKNRRQILHQNNIFELLRFLTLSVNELQEIATDVNNVLYSHEIENITNYIKSKNETDTLRSMGLNKQPRKTIQMKWQTCYRIPFRSTAPIVINSNNNIIQTRIRVNTIIVISALTVPTRMAPLEAFYENISDHYTEEMCVTIQNESDNTIYSTEFSQELTYNTTVKIPLKAPCLIKKHEWYKMSFIWPNNTTLSTYAVQHRSGFHVCDISQNLSFEFQNLPVKPENSGSFLESLTFCY